jgi:hypothetical protein
MRRAGRMQTSTVNIETCFIGLPSPRFIAGLLLAAREGK